MYTTTTATLPAVVASATSPSFTWGTSPGMTPTSMSINNNNHSNAENNNSRIALYTGYYHQYQQHVTEWRRRMGQEPQNTTLCDLAQKHIDWAQYQAEECSRTAHYFHENPTAGTTPFPLPPPPTPIPAAGHSSRNALEMNPVVNPNPSFVASTARSSSSSGPAKKTGPESSQGTSTSLKTYVDHNLAQCQNESERKIVTQRIQSLIQKAISDGTLHTKNWMTEPMVIQGSSAGTVECHLPPHSDPNSATCTHQTSGITTQTTRTSSQHWSNTGGTGQIVPVASSSVPSQEPRFYSSTATIMFRKDPTAQFEATTTTSSSSVNMKHHAYGRPNSFLEGNDTKASLTTGQSYYGSTVSTFDSNLSGVDNTAQYGYYGPSSCVNDIHTTSGTGKPISSGMNQMDSYTLESSTRKGSIGQSKTGWGVQGSVSSETHPDFNSTTATTKSTQVAKHKNMLSNLSHQPYSPSVQSKRKFKKQSLNSSSVTQNYYGPAFAEDDQFGSTTSTGSTDYIGLPSTKKANTTNASVGNGGFNQSTTVLNHRAQRFGGPGGLRDSRKSLPQQDYDAYMGKGMIGGKNCSSGELTEEDFERMTVKGTSQILEKEYLRLTAPPKPELVRPQSILEQHVQNLKTEWQNGDTNRRDYTWFCSQFKAVRQDCTVQRIQNSFTVDVYETHARIALQKGDLNEYNQCQTQLKELYHLLASDVDATRNRLEFLAYRLIYYAFLTVNEKYSGGSSDLLELMLSLTPSERQRTEIQHALQVRIAVAESDYHTFFRLHKACPNYGSLLMDHIVPTMRHTALKRICKAYRPTVPVEFIAMELGLEKEGVYCRKWLQSCGACLSADTMEVLVNDWVVQESDMEKKKSLI